MDPGPLLAADRLLHGVDESGDVVAGHGFASATRRRKMVLILGARFTACFASLGDHAELRPCLHSQQLDLEP